MGVSQVGYSLELHLIEFVPIGAFRYSVYFFITNLLDTHKTQFLASSERTV